MKSVSYDLAKDFHADYPRRPDQILPGGVADAAGQFGRRPDRTGQEAKPDTLTFGFPGYGTPHQIFAEEFKIMTGTTMRHITYKGDAAGTDRRGQRQHLDGVLRPHAGAAADPGRQAELHRGAVAPSAIPTCPTCRRWPRPFRAMRDKAGKASSPAPARRNRSSMRSRGADRRLERPQTAKRFNTLWASSPNGTRPTSSALSSRRKPSNGARSSGPRGLSRSELSSPPPPQSFLVSSTWKECRMRWKIGASTNPVAITMMRPDRIA